MIRDGRKRTVLYFGSVSPLDFLDWYFEIKERLKRDGFPVTHLALGTKTKTQKRITQVKRTEKRYIELFNANPSDASCLELYHVEAGIEYLSSCYLVNMVRLICRLTGRSFTMLVFDYSILDSISIETYMDITKKYIEWNKEVIFDCGKMDAPINYEINMRPWGFNEFKLISEKQRSTE